MQHLIDSSVDTLPEDVAKIQETVRSHQERLLAERPATTTRVFPSSRGFRGTADAGQRERGAGDFPLAAVEEIVTPPTDLPLERWLVQAHAYRETQAAKVGILARLFAGEVERVKGGVIHDAKRFSVIQTEQSRSCEVGVAVRLSVATASVRANLELTIPNLAAEAQLSNSDTRVGITVVGYRGPLGDLLPAPRKLDVETCVEYITAFQNIQKVIFGETGWKFVVPTVLSYEAN